MDVFKIVYSALEKRIYNTKNLLSEDYIDNIRINAFGSRFYEPAPKISFMSGLKLNL